MNALSYTEEQNKIAKLLKMSKKSLKKYQDRQYNGQKKKERKQKQSSTKHHRENKD